MDYQLLKNHFHWIIFILIGLSIVGIAVFLWKIEPMYYINFFLNRQTNPALFILLMAFLPAFGFPWSVFLVLTGLKFGTLWGILIVALVMPVHMALSYLLAKTVLHNLLKKLLAIKGYNLPDLSSKRLFSGMVLFVALPGPPYVLKNYLLALLDIPFFLYLGVNWLIEFILSIPVVGIGGAAGARNWNILFLFIALLIVFILARFLFKKKTQK